MVSRLGRLFRCRSVDRSRTRHHSIYPNAQYLDDLRNYVNGIVVSQNAIAANTQNTCHQPSVAGPALTAADRAAQAVREADEAQIAFDEAASAAARAAATAAADGESMFL